MAALREFLIGEEEEARRGVPRWGRAALPLAMPKDFATGREVKLSYK